jgi:hypothetical protein
MKRIPDYNESCVKPGPPRPHLSDCRAASNIKKWIWRTVLDIPKVIQNVFSPKFEETIPRKEVIIIDCATLNQYRRPVNKKAFISVSKMQCNASSRYSRGYNSL